jgi:hypothetical protein
MEIYQLTSRMQATLDSAPDPRRYALFHSAINEFSSVLAQ